MNTFGNKFRVSIFGESHGEAIGAVLDGVPAGLPLTQEDFMADIGRRMSGAKGTTPRREADLPVILSGVCDGHTTGAPLAVIFRNENTRSSDYDLFRKLPRPGHADRVAEVKWGGFNDARGGGHFSGRITLPLVAAGVVAKKILAAAAAGSGVAAEAGSGVVAAPGSGVAAALPSHSPLGPIPAASAGSGVAAEAGSGVAAAPAGSGVVAAPAGSGVVAALPSHSPLGPIPAAAASSGVAAEAGSGVSAAPGTVASACAAAPAASAATGVVAAPGTVASACAAAPAAPAATPAARIIEIGGLSTIAGSAADTETSTGPASNATAAAASQQELPTEVSALIEQAIKDGDSLGGVVECVTENLPVGLGEPFFNSVESLISHAIFSIPGVRGIEFGDGFAASRMRGSEHNDPFGPDGKPIRNGAGGINGGITNGAPLVFRVAFKPTSSISRPQTTLNFETGKLEELSVPGRHDVCFALRTPVIVEAVTAIVLADLL